MRASSISKAALALIAFTGLAEEAPRLPPELEELAGLARSLPAEFAADILLDVASRLGTKHRHRIRTMLEDAFALAERSREPMPRRTATAQPPDSGDAILEAAYSRGLDRLSLTARAVRQMHVLDPELAARYFDRLPLPPSDAHTCRDRMVWGSAPYWEAAAALGRTDLRGIVSPLEISPAIKALISLNLVNTPAAARFLQDVERLDGDDRAFTATLRTASRDLETLAIETARAKADPGPVLRTLARYLTRHLTGRRCGDTLEQSRTEARAFAWYYNDRLRVAGYLSKSELPPIRDEDMEAGSVIPVEAADSKPAWMELYQALRTAGADGVPHSKLYEVQPLIWWLAAEPMLKQEGLMNSPHPVLATYARARTRKATR